MKALVACAIIVCTLAAVSSADAKGCIKGAVVGGIAGHYAGQQAIAGAAAGCIVGHHEAKRRAQKKKDEGTRQTPELRNGEQRLWVPQAAASYRYL